MKFTKTVLFILATIGFLSLSISCEDHSQDSISDPIKQLSLHSDICCDRLSIDDGEKFILTGNSTCNLSEHPCISITGSMKRLALGNFEVRNGTLRIMNVNSGCFLEGDFQGWGINFLDKIKLQAVVKVTCGTGKLEANEGELLLTINGELTPDNQRLMNYTLDISGYLE